MLAEHADMVLGMRVVLRQKEGDCIRLKERAERNIVVIWGQLNALSMYISKQGT